MEADDHSRRIRALEQHWAGTAVRLSALERMSTSLAESIDELRGEQRADSQQILRAIEEVRKDVTLHIGMRKAATWMVGMLLAFVAAAIGAWNAWKTTP